MSRVAPEEGSRPLTSQSEVPVSVFDVEDGGMSLGDGSSLAARLNEAGGWLRGGFYKLISVVIDGMSSSRVPGYHGARLDGFEGMMDEEEDDGWMHKGDLDEFFVNVYRFYYERGFMCILMKGAVNVVTLGFTVVFSTFLLGFVDWNKLTTCKDEQTCFDFGEYVIGLHAHSSIFFRIFIVIYCLLFSAYWAWTVWAFLPHVRKMWEIRHFYLFQLGISTRKLQTMEWYEIVDRMISVQREGIHPIQLTGSFDAKDVAMRIMRKENYMIALISEDIFPVGTSLYDKERWFMGKNLELMLEFCILDQIFDTQYRFRRHQFTESMLRKRLFMFGVINLVLVPFSLGFMLIYFFLKYAEEFHSKKNYLGPRAWSTYAEWEIREYNELAHLFERRTAASIKHADHYIRQFPMPVPTVIGGGVSFIAGAFIAVLMLFTLVDESILLHIQLYGRNLVWYFAIFSAVLAISRSMVPPLEDTVFNPEKAMRRVATYSHFLPDRWRGRTHTYDVRDEFGNFFQFKVLLLLKEMLGILTTPFVLMYVLPDHAGLIVRFLNSRTISIDGIGDVCIYSTLDLAKDGDPRFHGPVNVRTDLGRFINLSEKSARQDGKLEKSWLGFKLNYPTWQDDSGFNPALDEKLVEFQKAMVEASMMRSRGVRRVDEESIPISPSNSMTSSMSVVAADVQRRWYKQRNDGGTSVSVNADHEFFSTAEAPVLPLDTFRYQNSENYFYWLEEYRDDILTGITHSQHVNTTQSPNQQRDIEMHASNPI